MVNIGSLLNASERINLEVKRATGGLPTSFWETYSAFANTFGGIMKVIIDANEKKFSR
ncbi:MAG: hypothetical protein LUC94_00595 [Clostridiales bacterium]|nr:hypothetical protein [Clostridiales bacterium]